MSVLLAGVRAAYGTLQLLLPAYSAEQLLGGPLEPPGLACVPRADHDCSRPWPTRSGGVRRWSAV